MDWFSSSTRATGVGVIRVWINKPNELGSGNDSKSIRDVNLLVGTNGPKNGFHNCLLTNERESGRAPGRGQNQVSDDLAH